MDAPRISPSPAANALAILAAAPTEGEVNQLRIFSRVPREAETGIVAVEENGVLLKAGEVAVYDRYSLQLDGGLVDGALYAVEYQRPVAGMSWSMWWGNGDHVRSRLQISRHVVIARRHPKLEGHWNIHPLAPRTPEGIILMTDGPFEEIYLADKILGRIVGIYRPEPGIEVAS